VLIRPNHGWRHVYVSQRGQIFITLGIVGLRFRPVKSITQAVDALLHRPLKASQRSLYKKVDITYGKEPPTSFERGAGSIPTTVRLFLEFLCDFYTHWAPSIKRVFIEMNVPNRGTDGQETSNLYSNPLNVTCLLSEVKLT